MISILTPAFNEAANLPALYERLIATMRGVGGDWEWVIVDDHSRDETFAVIEALALRDSRVRGFRLARNSGSHVAITCGLHHVEGDAAVMMAADLQDPPETLASMVARWREGAQVVWATRRVQPGELPDRFLGARFTQTASGKAAADRKRQRDEFSSDRRGYADEDPDECAGVRTRNEAGEESALERQVGRFVVEQKPRGDACHQRNAQREREHQPIEPAAPFKDQNVSEPPVAREHRREHRHDRQLDDERREEKLIRRQEFGAVKHPGHCKQWPGNPKSQIPHAKSQSSNSVGVWTLGFGIWDLPL